MLWTIVYFVIAFKRVYREGWGWTLGKLAALGTGYSLVFAAALVLTAFVSFLAS